MWVHCRQCFFSSIRMLCLQVFIVYETQEGMCWEEGIYVEKSWGVQSWEEGFFIECTTLIEGEIIMNDVTGFFYLKRIFSNMNILHMPLVMYNYFVMGKQSATNVLHLVLPGTDPRTLLCNRAVFKWSFASIR